MPTPCTRPVMVMHGDADGIIPWEMGQALYAAAVEPKEFWLVPGAGHLEATERLPEEVRPRLVAFFERALD